MTDTATNLNRMEKLADNATLRAWSRLAMVGIVPVLLALGSLALYLYNSDISRIRDDIARITAERQANTNSITGMQREIAVMQNADAIDRLADQRWKDSMDAKMDELRQSINNVENSTSALNTAVQAVVREVERARP